MESSKKKGIVALAIIAVAIFGYSQYASASHITVNVAQSELLQTDGSVSDYNIKLEFENPSLLVLAAGETEFFIESDGETVGEGMLEAFTLSPLNDVMVNGTYRTNSEGNIKESESVDIRISGVTEYDLWFTSIDVPFVYHPTGEQAIDFIHQG